LKPSEDSLEKLDPAMANKLKAISDPKELITQIDNEIKQTAKDIQLNQMKQKECYSKLDAEHKKIIALKEDISSKTPELDQNNKSSELILKNNDIAEKLRQILSLQASTSELKERMYADSKEHTENK